MNRHKFFYFAVSQGLRGCYMPDSLYILKTQTRKGLKKALESEAYSIRDAGFVGCSKKAVAALAAECWRSRGRSTLDNVAPYRSAKATRPQDYPYGLFCSASSKEGYKEQEAEINR
jgi:hypothetical protein